MTTPGRRPDQAELWLKHRQRLLEERERGSDIWSVCSTAARVEVMLSSGMPWEAIEDVVDLEELGSVADRGDDADEEPLDLREAVRTIVGQAATLVAVAKEILDKESAVRRTEPGAIGLDWGRVWELVTEHGTRILIDLRSGRATDAPICPPRWMRLPSAHADGTTNSANTDNTWQRLALLEPAGDDDHHDAPRGMRRRVVIGKPARIYLAWKEWWTTTTVVSVRALTEAEAPTDGIERLTMDMPGRWLITTASGSRQEIDLTLEQPTATRLSRSTMRRDGHPLPLHGFVEGEIRAGERGYMTVAKADDYDGYLWTTRETTPVVSIVKMPDCE